MKYIDTSMPKVSWEAVPGLERALEHEEGDALFAFIDLVIRTFFEAPHSRLQRLMFDLSMRSIKRGNPSVGLLVIEALETGLVDAPDNEKNSFISAMTVATEHLLVGPTSEKSRADALYVRHVLRFWDGSGLQNTKELQEAAQLGQRFALFDLAEYSYNTNDIDSYVRFALGAMKAGHSIAALHLIERYARFSKGVEVTLLLEAARQMAERGLVVGMVDLGLFSTDSQYAMFIAAAAGSEQALRILASDKRFACEDTVVGAAVTNLSKVDRHEGATTVLQQTAACLLLEKLLKRT